ncbi:phage BR0599 family protein [Candidatus Cyrtobacter comes]|nr:phage BR0599 family protein [Candidatus Cyrtobacter comes]
MKEKFQIKITCCKINTIYNGSICFSDYNKGFFFKEEYYEAQRLGSVSSVSKSRDVEHDNFEIRVFMYDKNEREIEVFSSLIEGGSVDIFTLDEALTEEKKIQSGIVSQIKMSDKVLYITVYGIGSLLQRPLTEAYSLNCRAIFGDHRCKFDRSKMALKGQIEEVLGKNKFRILENITKQYNSVKFISGNNAGREIEIDSINGSNITIILDNLLFSTGDIIELMPGCDKSIKTCSSVYKNALNFRGEPHIPTVRTILNKS